MSTADVKEIMYHCQCRRFVLGSPAAPCLCNECGRQHTPDAGYAMGEERPLSNDR